MQRLQLIGDRALVQNAQHGVLAIHARHDGDAEVDRPVVDRDLEAAVLRHAPLGDIELRHHLDARDHLLGTLDRPRRWPHARERRRCDSESPGPR